MMFMWDASNHDWSRGPMNLAKAKAEGISGFTHKAGEGIPNGMGDYLDPWFGEAMRRAKAAAFPVIGAYYVNWPGDQISQADRLIELVQKYAPWWREVCFIFQLDAEKFSNMPRAPTMAECNQFCSRIIARTGCSPKAVPNYAPAWLYGSQVAAMNVPNWWQSAYGSNPFGQFNLVAPSPADPRWAPMNGKTPAILQYSSQTTIAGQRPADANAVRVNTVAELQALLGGAGSSGSPRKDDEMILVIRGTQHSVMGNGIPLHVMSSPADENAYLSAKTSDGTPITAVINVTPAEEARLNALLSAVPTQLGKIVTNTDTVEASLKEELAAVKGLPTEIAAKLGSAPGGGATPTQIKQSVKDALAEGTGTTPSV